MPLRRSQLLAPIRTEDRASSANSAPDDVNLNAPVQRLAKLWLEQVKTQPQRRVARRAGDVALKLVKEMGRDPEPQMSALKENWAEIAGPSFASRTAPEKFIRAKDGLTLVLKVEGAAAPMISHQIPQILARVNLYAGPPGVKQLAIVQGPVGKIAAKTAAKKPQNRVGLGRIDSSQEAEIETLLANVADEKLKASLRRLGRGIYARAAAKGF